MLHLLSQPGAPPFYFTFISTWIQTGPTCYIYLLAPLSNFQSRIVSSASTFVLVDSPKFHTTYWFLLYNFNLSLIPSLFKRLNISSQLNLSITHQQSRQSTPLGLPFRALHPSYLIIFVFTCLWSPKVVFFLFFFFKQRCYVLLPA